MNSILVPILVTYIPTIWIVVIFFYTPACLRLRKMMDLIDREGELNSQTLIWSIQTTGRIAENWFIYDSYCG
jgi:hypothetical protein